MATGSSQGSSLRPEGGFSFVELVVIVFLVGTLALLAAPDLHQTLLEMEVERAAVEIQNLLRYARSQSVVGFPYLVTFDTASNTITVIDDESKTPASHPTKKFQDCTLRLGIAGSFEHVDLSKADFGGQEKVMFDRLGNANAGGTVVVAGGEFQRTVRVSAPGGKTGIER